MKNRNGLFRPSAVQVAPRVLLVDDDPIFRQEFVDCFDEFGLLTVSSGAEAVLLLQKPNEIDLVILDVKMSGMDGIEVLEKIKEIASEVKVVILTGYSSKDVAIDALRGRADDYLEKPLNISLTRETIEKYLRVREVEAYGRGTEDKIKRVKDFLTRNFHKKVTLQDAAKAVCLSPKYLSRIFKEYAKQGFNEFKLSLRLHQAKLLLQDRSLTVDQISDSLGYQNPESFIRQFKKSVKTTPAQYRSKKHKK